MIQYYHSHRKSDHGKHTVALVVPTKAILRSLFSEVSNKLVRINLGLAQCNPIDQYNKKTGRDLAVKRLTQHEFILNAVEFKGDFTFFYLQKGGMVVVLKTAIKSEHTYFVDVQWELE